MQMTRNELDTCKCAASLPSLAPYGQVGGRRASQVADQEKDGLKEAELVATWN
jgi:hypothetical protein